MARRSTIEAHPRRDDIALALISDVPIRDIADLFAVSKSALTRFKKTIPRTIAVAEEAKGAALLELGNSLLEHTTDLQKAALDFFNHAVMRGDEAAAAIWFDRLLKAIPIRLQVELARENRPEKSIISARIEKQASLSKMSDEFLQLYQQAKRTTSSGVIDITPDR